MAFLGREDDGLQSGPPKRLTAGHALALVKRFALADGH
jgi:hypothetical protein